MIRFFRKSKSQELSPQAELQPVPKFMPPEVREDSATDRVAEQKVNSWMDEAFAEFERNGGMEHLPGKGKPLTVELGKDPFSDVLKNANVLPPWLELQHEIRSLIEKQLYSKSTDSKLLSLALKEINELISEYNRICPSPLLQKTLVNADTLESHFQRWQ